ncbi:MAG TPA: hypothetical protein V6C96_02215, partial [Vampirovibrionales bacterium]
VETIKNEFIEFKVFAAARVYTNFEAEKGESLTTYFSNHQGDVSAMAEVLYLGHLSWSKLTENSVVVKDREEIMDKLDLFDIANGLTAMLGISNEVDPKAVKKK